MPTCHIVYTNYTVHFHNGPAVHQNRAENPLLNITVLFYYFIFLILRKGGEDWMHINIKSQDYRITGLQHCEAVTLCVGT